MYGILCLAFLHVCTLNTLVQSPFTIFYTQVPAFMSFLSLLMLRCECEWTKQSNEAVRMMKLSKSNITYYYVTNFSTEAPNTSVITQLKYFFSNFFFLLYACQHMIMKWRWNTSLMFFRWCLDGKRRQKCVVIIIFLFFFMFIARAFN